MIPPNPPKDPHGHEELYQLINKAQKKQGFENIESLIGSIQAPTQIFHDFAAEPFTYVEPLLNLSKEQHRIVNCILTPIEISRTALRGGELLGNGASLIVHALHFQEAKNLLKQRESQLRLNPLDKDLSTLISKLRNYISVYFDDLKEKIADFSTTFLTVGLNVSSFVTEAMKEIHPLINYSIGWAFYLLDVLTSAISLWRAEKAKTTYDTWTQKVARNPRFINDAKKLLAQRQERLILKKIENMPFEDLKVMLQEKGLNVQVESLNEFKAKLDEEPFRREAVVKLLSAQDEKEEALLTSLRNGVQALADAKIKSEKKFFVFNYFRAGWDVGLSSLSATLVITLEALTLLGIISVATSAMAVPILTLFLGGWVLWGVGLYLFYKHRPNLFMSYVRGINLRLAFYQIPAKIRHLQWNQKKYEIEFLENKQKQYKKLENILRQKITLDRKAYPKKFHKALNQVCKDTVNKMKGLEIPAKEQYEETLNNILIQQKLYEKKIALAKSKELKIQKKLEWWHGKKGIITKLQNHLTNAGIKDFALSQRLLRNVKGVEIELSSLIKEEMSALDFSHDEELQAIFRNQMDIDLTKSQKVVLKQLKQFFKMDESDLLHFMKQKIH